ncbi:MULTISPECIES: GNAT family N-acetyltransferase [unclassified Streptomyces]|uniref:GNAT family N-acetyltransferase n=1 Tax=unclassified Streptomyces TaxID=2593676 RepID=UPI0035E11BD1
MTVRPHTTITLAPMTDDHAPAVMAIYQQGIDEGNATFETAAPPWSAFDTAKSPAHRFVALDPRGRVVGWTAVSPVSARPAYAGVVEHSVYVDPAARGTGVGRALLTALIDSTERAGIWTVQAGVFPENEASLALHASVGFRVLGRRERVARHHGVWRDVLLVERRSPAVV